MLANSLKQSPRGAPQSAIEDLAAPPTIAVETITTYEELLELRPVWDALVEEARVDNPFLTHEWIVTSWECFGPGNTPYILLVKAGDRPVAIAPFMLGRQRIFGMDLRRLGFIYHVSTERQDLIAVPWHPGIRRAIWNHLADHRHLWDVLILPQIPTDSPTARELPELAAEEGFLTGRWPSSVALHIPLKGRWEDYVNGLDRKFRYNIRSRMRRLSALGRVGLEVVDARDQVPSALEDGLRIEAAAWKGRVGTAIACQPQVRDFYTRLAQRAAMRDWLRLHFLTFEGRRIAFAYNLEYKGVLYLLKTGYDPQYSAYSPSTMLATLLLQRAFERRVTRYELLGDAEPWKLEWTGHSTSHCWVFVMRNTARTRLVHFAKFHLLPRLKKSRHFSILHQSFLALPRILRRFGSTRARP